MSRARDLMTEDPITVPLTATVADAIRAMQELHVRHLPVVDEDDAVAGMLSDRDLRALALPSLVDEQWIGEIRVALATPVAKVMSSDVFSVLEETETTEIIELMLENSIGAVPVVNGDGAVVGIVSYVDVLRELQQLERDAAE